MTVIDIGPVQSPVATRKEETSKPVKYVVILHFESTYYLQGTVDIHSGFLKALADVFMYSDQEMESSLLRALRWGDNSVFGPYSKDVAETLCSRANDVVAKHYCRVKPIFTYTSEEK